MAEIKHVCTCGSSEVKLTGVEESIIQEKDGTSIAIATTYHCSGCNTDCVEKTKIANLSKCKVRIDTA